MAQTVQLKRSSVPGKVPTTSDLALGEIAINTYDGKVFTKKDNGTPSIVEIGAGGGGTTNLSTTANSSTVVVASDTGTDATLVGANSTTAGLITSVAQTIAGDKTFKGIPVFDNGGGDEGGELRLATAVTNSSLNGPIAIDIYQNRLRIFETGGSNRGVYIDFTSASTGVGSNLLTGGSSNSTPTNLSSSANSSTVSIFSDTGTDVVLAAANSTTAGVLTAVAQTIAGDKTFTNVVSADYFNSTNNGNGTNYKIGDDAWIGDVNVANALRISGQQDASQAYLIFGNGDNTALSRTGTGRLKYGGSDVILASDTSSLATPSTIVIRDGLGNFIANTITASLSGNATTATTLQTSRTISLGGDLSGSASFNGSADVTITATIQPNSVALGTDTTGNYVAGLTGGTGVTISGSAGEGWSPTVAIGQDVSTTSNVQFNNLVVSGNLTVNGTTTTVNANNLAISDNMIYLNEGSTITNPDLGWVGNYNDGTYSHTGIFRDASDNRWRIFQRYTPEPGQTIDITDASFQYADLQANTFYGALSGNATTATTLQTGRTISITGDISYTSPSFNGSSNVTASATLANSGVTAGTYGSSTSVSAITVDAKGRVTSASNTAIAFPVTSVASKTGAVTLVSTDITDAASTSTASVLVLRDASQNFSANTITASLSGNATTATTLQTARTINGVSFNGSSNITITAANPNALTIGTGLSGTSYDGSAGVTIAIDSTVATLTGSQTLSNKTISSGILTGTLTANGAVGTAGQVLTSNGSGVYWSTVTGGGGGGATNLTLSSNSSTVSIFSDTGTDVTILAANSTTAGVLTADTQTIAGSKTFTSNASFSANVAITGTVTSGTWNAVVKSRVVSYTDATSITINADTTDLATMINTQAAGTFTINAPTGTLFDGQKLMLKLKCNNIQTFNWNAVFIGSTDAPLPSTSSGSSKTDYLGFIYDTTTSKWHVIAKNFGY